MLDPQPEAGNPQLEIEHAALIRTIDRLSPGAEDLPALEQAIVEAMTQRLPHYSWAGFYMLDPVDPETLVLGPFVGEPTPHVRIPINQGICGAAAAAGKTIVVDDVNADPRYLSCSLRTRSEIVVPIYAHGAVAGEIDIDSHEGAAFSDADRVFLEEVARIVGAFIERHSGPKAELPAGESRWMP